MIVIFNIQFCFGLMHFKPKTNFDFFSRKIVIYLAHIFTMEKALIKIIFWHEISICVLIFKNFVAYLMTFGMQMDDAIMVCWRCFRKVRFRKRHFLKNGVWTVGNK